MAQSNNWVKDFRRTIKTSVGSGWTVENDRGNMRLIVGNKAEGRTSINLPYQWEEAQWPEAIQFIKHGADIYKENNGLIPVKTAFKTTLNSSSERKLDWEGALISYRKERSDIKEGTWKKKHKPVLDGVMFYMNKAMHKPQNARALYKKVINEYKHGQYNQLVGWPQSKPTIRRHMRLAFNKFLDYCCIEEEFPSYWRPTYGNFKDKNEEKNILKNKRIGYPLTDSQIGRLVDNFTETPQAQKWKFAVQLCSVYGLRPEELNHLVLRNNKTELWSIYQKVNSNFKERKLLPFAVRDIDGKPFDWNYNLVQRLAAGEQLPNMQDGNGGQTFGDYLRRKSIKNVWLSICEEAKAEGLECVPYSFRHRYAYVAHTRPQEDGTFRSPKQIANMMGLDPEIHFDHYARFETKDLDKSSDLAELQKVL